MFTKLFRGASLIAVPTLFLYYDLKKHNRVHALTWNKKELEIDRSSINQETDQLIVKRKLLIDNFLSSTFKKSKDNAQNLIEAFRTINQAPGVVCGVSYRGKEIWSFGQGLADVETKARLTDDSVMRIASISKCMTMLLLGKLLEDGKLDLDKPISTYLNKDIWPEKYFQKKKFDITLRQLVQHIGGIRHYNVKPGTDETDAAEYHLREHFDNVYDALRVFKNDDLINEPGTKFCYSTYGFVLVSAVIQSVLEKDKKFEDELIKLLRDDLRMTSTYLDFNDKIVPNRTRYYLKDKSNKEKLINAYEIDNSYKWAGGGFLSNVHDILKYGNAMMYSYKTSNGILKQETLKEFWTPNQLCPTGKIGDLPCKHGMGMVIADENLNAKFKEFNKKYMNKAFFHTGAAVGVTSILLILPEEEIVVALMANQNETAGIGQLAMDIAKGVCDNLEEINELV